jgi:hypothetical protein
VVVKIRILGNVKLRTTDAMIHLRMHKQGVGISMDNNFEFSIESAHQTPTKEDLPTTRIVHSGKAPHGLGMSGYKFGYVNDIRPCPACLGKVHG